MKITIKKLELYDNKISANSLRYTNSTPTTIDYNITFKDHNQTGKELKVHCYYELRNTGVKNGLIHLKGTLKRSDNNFTQKIQIKCKKIVYFS